MKAFKLTAEMLLESREGLFHLAYDLYELVKIDSQGTLLSSKGGDYCKSFDVDSLDIEVHINSLSVSYSKNNQNIVCQLPLG